MSNRIKSVSYFKLIIIIIIFLCSKTGMHEKYHFRYRNQNTTVCLDPKYVGWILLPSNHADTNTYKHTTILTLAQL